MRTIEPFTPIQYIMGKTEFCGLDFAVDERVLIPRPETELLVKSAIDIFCTIPNTQYPLRILDLCTGSGNIAISLTVRLCSPSTLSGVEGLTKNLPDCRIVASDISDSALEVARKNAADNDVSGRIEFARADLFEGLSGKFDIIVSNPPYIAKDEFDGLQKEVLKEPRIALDGGEDGLDFYRRIAFDAPRYLNKCGFLVLEIGYGQLSRIAGILENEGGFCLQDIVKDHNGINRVTVFQPRRLEG